MRPAFPSALRRPDRRAADGAGRDRMVPPPSGDRQGRLLEVFL